MRFEPPWPPLRVAPTGPVSSPWSRTTASGSARCRVSLRAGFLPYRGFLPWSGRRLSTRHAREGVPVRVSKPAPFVTTIAVRIQAASRHVPDTKTGTRNALQLCARSVAFKSRAMPQFVRGHRRDDGQGFVHTMIASSHRERRGETHAQITSAAPPRDHEVHVRDQRVRSHTNSRMRA